MAPVEAAVTVTFSTLVAGVFSVTGVFCVVGVVVKSGRVAGILLISGKGILFVT